MAGAMGKTQARRPIGVALCLCLLTFVPHVSLAQETTTTAITPATDGTSLQAEMSGDDTSGTAVETATDAAGEEGGVILEEVVDAAPAPTAPQTTGSIPVLVFDRERILAGSLLGQAFDEKIRTARRELLDENAEIFAALEEEEKALSDLRPTLPEEEFALKAEAFDNKVIDVRKAQDLKGEDIQALYETELAGFERAMNAALASVARDVRAVVVFERQQVYLMSGAIDASNEVIRRLDSVLITNQDTVDDGAATSDTPPRSETGTTDP